jgi:hypothetical protein
VVPQATPQPVAPASNLVPLPYSAAVAARFPDPATRYDTPGLAPQRNQFTTAIGLTAWPWRGPSAYSGVQTSEGRLMAGL